MFEEINFWHLAIIPVIHNTMTSEVWLKTSLFVRDMNGVDTFYYTYGITKMLNFCGFNKMVVTLYVNNPVL